jgi:hypothetical protein
MVGLEQETKKQICTYDKIQHYIYRQNRSKIYSQNKNNNNRNVINSEMMTEKVDLLREINDD